MPQVLAGSTGEPLASAPPARKLDALLGFISGPSISLFFMQSVFNTFRMDPERRFGASWLIVFGPYIHSNRNRLVEQFLQTDRDWFFSVDNDMVFEPEDVWALFEEADRHGPGIYAAAYILEDATLVSGPWDDVEPAVYHRMGALPTEPTRVGMVGMGFTLIHRDVLEAVGPEPYTALTSSHGEDVSFCWRAHQQGYDPLLVPKADPGHSKNFVVHPSGSVRNVEANEVNLVRLDREQMEEVKNG